MQIIGSRLAISALNMAYGLKHYPLNGPFPMHISLIHLPDGGFTTTITYDCPLNYAPELNHVMDSGFYACIGRRVDEDYDQCDVIWDTWGKVNDILIFGYS